MTYFLGKITSHVAKIFITEHLKNCIPKKRGFFRYTRITVNILHKVDNDNDDHDHDNNNNKNKHVTGEITSHVAQTVNTEQL
jgi:hypothetical protein